MNESPDRLSMKQTGVLAGMFLLPALLMAGKLTHLCTSEFLLTHFSLLGLPAKMQGHVGHILFVPLGAILVVVFRLTLGIRVLGPFRSILLAFAFGATGIPLGLVFLAVTTFIIITIIPLLKGMRLPYFGRISVLLSGVALIVVVGILAGNWLDLHALRKVAYFPLVVLCLISDAFARTVSQEGIRSALWRGGMTTLLAVLLAYFFALPQLRELLLRFPELLGMQTGCIVLLSRFCSWRYFERLNPKLAPDRDEDLDEDGPRATGITPRLLDQPPSDSVVTSLVVDGRGASSNQEPFMVRTKL
jgi:hypothetical protein